MVDALMGLGSCQLSLVNSFLENIDYDADENLDMSPAETYVTKGLAIFFIIFF